jgi:hypothetical protein
MPFSTLPPRIAATLSEDVYNLNNGDERALEDFLSSSVLSSPQQLTAHVGGHVLRSTKDAFGVCATGTGIFENHLFLIFRGTTTQNNKADFLTDARIGLTRSNSNFPVHIGFAHAFKSMQTEIAIYVANLRNAGMQISGVHCMGHSLGGAVAALAAEWAHSHVCKNVKLYTFGQPKVGLTLFSESLTHKLGKNNIHRVFHTTDPVPMIPVFPYVHSPLPGLGHRINSDHLIHTAEAHRMEHYINHVKGKNWHELERAAPIFNHEHAIESWLKSNINQNPNCPKTFEWLEKAIIWLLTKALGKFVNVAQLAIMGIHTYVDKLAWALAKGIELGEKAGKYVQLFMAKVMRILRIPKTKNTQNPTTAFFKYLLNELIRRANQMAMQAIRSINTVGT